MSHHIDIVFDGPPDHHSPRFVEVENAAGRSINFGRWVKRDDGYWALRFHSTDAEPLEAAKRIAAFDSSFPRYDEWDDDLTRDAQTVAAAFLEKAEGFDEVGEQGTAKPMTPMTTDGSGGI